MHHRTAFSHHHTRSHHRTACAESVHCGSSSRYVLKEVGLLDESSAYHSMACSVWETAVLTECLSLLAATVSAYAPATTCPVLTCSVWHYQLFAQAGALHHVLKRK
eukprot:871984-Rhodomonas_salina.1